MPDTRFAFAHREPLMVPAPDGVDDAISAVMAQHRAELDEALAPFGVTLADLVDPTWMRIVRMSDVEPPGSWAEDLVDSLTPAEAAAAARALGVEYTIDGADPEHIATGTRADVADLPPCDCGSVDKNGDDLGEHDPTCPYHLEAVRRWGITVVPGDAAMTLEKLAALEPRPTDLEGD